MSTYIKEFLSIVEIYNKECHRCSNMKPYFEVIYDKLIMSLEVLHNSNFSRQIDHPIYTTLTKDTVVLDVMLQNNFNDSFLDDVICENYSSGGSESMKSIFNVSRYLNKPHSVLKILFQGGT